MRILTGHASTCLVFEVSHVYLVHEAFTRYLMIEVFVFIHEYYLSVCKFNARILIAKNDSYELLLVF